MSTSHRSVACSFELLNCYQILELVVNDEDDNPIFQPKLIEEEIYRLLRGLHVLPKVDTNEISMKSQAELVGKYVNGISDTTQVMEVVAYFGKQSIVKTQLNKDGFWPEFLDKYLDSNEEGVYAISPSITESNRRIVIFAWLSDTSFDPDHLRERATFVLRFLTSLTSHVVCCLPEGFDNLTTTSVCDSLTSKKYSMSYSMQKTKLECIPDETYHWHSHYENGRLIPGSNVSFYTMKLDRSSQFTLKYEKLSKGNDFVNWFTKLSSTHTIEINCMIPESWMIQFLESKDAYPHEYIDSITPKTIQIPTYDELMNEIHGKMKEFAKKYKKWAEYCFYLKSMTCEEEIQSKAMLDECIAKLKEWNRIYSVDMAPFLIDFQSILDGKIQQAYKRHPSYQSTSNQRKVIETKSIPFPYMKFKNQDLIHEILKSKNNKFRGKYGKWCNFLDEVCNDSNLLTKMTNEELENRLKPIQVAEELAMFRKSEAIGDAFLTLVGKINNLNQHRLRVKIDKIEMGMIYREEELKEEVEILTRYKWKDNIPVDDGYFNVPFQSKVKFITKVNDFIIVIFTGSESNGDISSTIHVYKKRNKFPHYIKHFPQEILLVDFDSRQKLVGLLYSKDVEFYKFDEFYKGLERVGGVKLANLKVSCPFTCMLLFHHGMTLIDDNGYVQSYFIETKLFSKMEIDLLGIGNTKVVKIYGGDLILFLTREENDRMPKEYTVIVKCMATGDNSMLPVTRINIPNTITWMNCMFESYEDQLVCFDPVASVVRTWRMHLVTGKTTWKLKESHEDHSMDNGLESHPLWCLFHLFEKFPVQSRMAKTSKEGTSLVSDQLFLHVVGSNHKRSVVAILELVMKRLARHNKCITPLKLVQDLKVHSSNPMPWIASTVSMAKWIMELISIVPVQICRTYDNQLVLLRNGKEDESPQGSEAHEVAKSIWFGPVSSILQHWSGSVVVLSSMGKQSTGKSYYLNHLTGSSFAISSATYMDGVWLTVRLLSPTCLLVVLDFEGLGSFERSSQEDTLLSVLNAAISRLTVFRIEMRFDNDIDAMFSKFQQGASLLKGDHRLFKGKLYFNVKDVNPNDEQSVILHFQSKLKAILNEFNEVNFVTTMYSGQIEITCSPPLGNVGYYEALHDGLELLEKAAQSTPYTNGFDFYDCLTMVLSKISLLN